MSGFYLAAGISLAGLSIYLLIALLFPERF